jgi:predicted membrane protein
MIFIQNVIVKMIYYTIASQIPVSSAIRPSHFYFSRRERSEFEKNEANTRVIFLNSFIYIYTAMMMVYSLYTITLNWILLRNDVSIIASRLMKN